MENVRYLGCSFPNEKSKEIFVKMLDACAGERMFEVLVAINTLRDFLADCAIAPEIKKKETK